MPTLTRKNTGPAYASSALSPVVTDIVAEAAGQMSGLQHFIDPAAMGPASTTEFSRSRGDGRPIVFTGGTKSIGAPAGYGGRRAVTNTGGAGEIAVGPGGCNSQSFTWVVACAMDAAMRAGTTDGYLLSVYNPESPDHEQYLKFVGGGSKGISCRTAAGETQVTVPFANIPAAGIPFILAASYDAATTSCRIYLNSTASAAASADDRAAPPASATAKLRLFGLLANTGVDWIGSAGMALAFDEAYHTSSQRLEQLNTLMTSMKTYYGIV